jgi:hypothetical protein
LHGQIAVVQVEVLTYERRSKLISGFNETTENASVSMAAADIALVRGDVDNSKGAQYRLSVEKSEPRDVY